MVAKAQVARGVFKIGPLPTGKFRTAEAPTCPYVCVGQERAAILEPGEEGQASPILQALEDLGIERDRIAYITASHIHLHHMEGINVLLEVLPQAKVVVHQRAVAHLLDPTRLNASINQVWGLVGGHCGRLNPVPPDRILGCAGGEVLDLGGRELEIVDSRGHAPHHICVFDRLTGAMWTGDMVALSFGSERGSPDIMPPLFDVKMHIAGLRRCRALKPTVLFSFTGRGGVSYVPDQTLQWAEEDILTIERICRDGMKNKMTAQEIGRNVAGFRGGRRMSFSPLITATTMEEETVGTRGGHIGLLHAQPGTEMGEEPPLGLLTYLKREDPSLEWPQGMPGAPGAGRGL